MSRNERREEARRKEQERNAAARRRVEKCSIPKEDLLRILQDEGFAPISATKIIGTGHGLDELTFTVTFD